ncbi:phosphatidylglycerophosphatase A [Helicobacter sp. MIT 14-3879]|uniref:phosphatidylglycerophosphatase A family protein n=1 Tax=Helicobacter sp. MIT 14-3879 TaxID=2040649 RepID=UPI000E1E5663|nr:phosphatidylglycerophosphatase A [Helicobacter sp. MIT 14-3879]RDU65626.1 phosphatidylglycerophosphatase A [Helicobacter sp. MIT 14-3879]
MDSVRENFLTLFRVGYFKKAPGTWGSFFGLLLGIPILYFSAFSLLLLAALIGIIAIKQIDIYEENTKIHDAKHIVIDEVVGIFIAMSIAQFSIPSIILSFIFFRLYDIYKPSVIGKIDSNVNGGLGVVGDDVLAGFFAGITSLIFISLFKIISYYYL